MGARLQYMFERTQGKTLLLLTLGILLLVFAAGQNLIAQQRLSSVHKLSETSYDAIIQTENIGRLELAMDQPTREGKASRHTVEAQAQQIETSFDRLEFLVSGDPTQQANVHAARKLSAHHSQQLVDVMTTTGRSTDIESRQKVLKAVDAEALEIRNMLHKIIKRERARLTELNATTNQAQRWTIFSTIAFLATGLLVVFYAIQSAVRTDMSLRDHAILREREEKLDALRRSEEAATQQARLFNMLNSASTSLASEHDFGTIVQEVVDIGRALTSAETGAFFFVSDDDGEQKMHLEAASGIRCDTFPDEPTFLSTLFQSPNRQALLIDDIAEHPIFGQCSSFHPTMKSVIGVPVLSSASKPIGVIMFGHAEAKQFSDAHLETVRGLAGMTSIVLENATLYSEAENEIAERTKTEQKLRRVTERQNLLLQELNHRVKNTLVIVQSIAAQTKNTAIKKLGIGDQPVILNEVDRFYNAFESRLLSLSATHDLLVKGAWGDVYLSQALWAALKPLVNKRQVFTEGPLVALSPNTAVTLNMIFHELGTNAVKYGAASNDEGQIEVIWVVEDGFVNLSWKETGGPPIKSREGEGFGSKLLQRAVVREMKGKASIEFHEDGIECRMSIPLGYHVKEVSDAF